MVTRADERQVRLIRQYIEADPWRPGASEAVLNLEDAAVPVWALAADYRATGEDLDLLAAHCAILHEAAEAAIAFYRRYQPQLDERIAQNERAGLA